MESFMNLAIELSDENIHTKNGGPFGAVIVKDSQIVGKGNNRVTSTNDPSAHAEVMAIRDACKNLGTFDLSGCEIYTSCEPCPMCLGCIYWARLKKIYYANSRSDAAKIGFDDAFIYEEISKDLAQRQIPAEQMMQQQAFEVFHKWHENEDKQMY
jgi:guanine deaminase